MTEKKQKKTDFFKTLIFAIVVAMTIRTLLFESFNIPSGSMINTLLIGDYLFVNKFNYGYGKYSFPFGLAPFKGRVFHTSPKRGDVVVFRTDKQPGMDFIKRVVGLPGDRIQVKSGVLHINDKPVKLIPKETTKYVDQDGRHYIGKVYEETLPNGIKHPVVLDEPLGEGSYDNTDVYRVPKGHLFMMGDHRHRSGDSRDLKHMGFIPMAYVVGQASIIFFSIDKSSPGMWKLWEWPSRIRWKRLFQLIN